MDGWLSEIQLRLFKVVVKFQRIHFSLSVPKIPPPFSTSFNVYLPKVLLFVFLQQGAPLCLAHSVSSSFLSRILPFTWFPLSLHPLHVSVSPSLPFSSHPRFLSEVSFLFCFVNVRSFFLFGPASSLSFFLSCVGGLLCGTKGFLLRTFFLFWCFYPSF